MQILYDIAGRLDLGAVAEPPRRLTGGFTHRMYSLTTVRGRFAVKLLNPHIMARPDAMDNFRRAESLEALLEKTAVPILPALRFGGEKMQALGGQYFYIYDWFDGRALSGSEILPSHCSIIGAGLAQIHRIDRREEPCAPEPIGFDWDFLTGRLLDAQPELGALVKGRRDMLHECQRRANEAFGRLPAVTAICHSDMDSKNVLWRGDECRIIDLECLGRSNPHLELYETALYWSGIEECSIDPQRFEAFIRSYAEAGGELPPDWAAVHDANAGRLGWLEYNIRRALGMDCAEDEIAIGISETKKTLAQLECYMRIREKLV